MTGGADKSLWPAAKEVADRPILAGPLAGFRAVAVGGIGPAPFAAMLLADMGAEVIRVDPPGWTPPPAMAVLGRGQRLVGLDLKRSGASGVISSLVASADCLIEGFRPDVAERLGIGPDVCLGYQPRLVYARMTGWGQSGPYAGYAGHDLTYLAMNGVLDSLGVSGGPPAFPINLLGDFGGGGMLIAFGIVCALLSARATGRGQVVDAAMIDGSALLTAHLHGLINGGIWDRPRGENFLDGGAHFYNVYRTADDRYVAIGALEEKFYGRLIAEIGLDETSIPGQWEETHWPAMKKRFADVFAAHTRDEWCDLLLDQDVCFAPVLSFKEAASDPHLSDRGTFIEVDGVRQPAPAPRLSGTPAVAGRSRSRAGHDTDDVIRSLGIPPEEIARLREHRVLA